jgi:hypothetical protein
MVRSGSTNGVQGRVCFGAAEVIFGQTIRFAEGIAVWFSDPGFGEPLIDGELDGGG